MTGDEVREKKWPIPRRSQEGATGTLMTPVPMIAADTDSVSGCIHLAAVTRLAHESGPAVTAIRWRSAQSDDRSGSRGHPARS